MTQACSSCKTPVANMKGAAVFKCPSCGKTDLVRCRHCREIAAAFSCHECGFSGPN
ncbi:RNA-binding protein [Candidatus Woesearchaeota archaeon]|nr:RNA-binding protein [Candidatus Woesearchaeota archaeon]